MATTAAVTEEDLKKTKETWDTIDIDKMRQVAWMSVPYFQDVIWGRFSDGEGPVKKTLKVLKERMAQLGRERLRGIALACGDMAGERCFFEDEMLPFERADGYDLSDVVLARYAPKPGLHFVPHVEDVNRLRLEPESADLIVGWLGLHHIHDLANLFEQARRALKPGGVLAMYEWIGPELQQIPLTNRIVSKLLLYLLFPRKKTRTTHMGDVKGWKYIHHPPSAFEPSEACNSTQLAPEYRRHFRSLHEDLHGALIFPMFEGIAQNLDHNSKLNRARFFVVQKVEEWLTRAGVIHPLYMVAIGEPHPNP
jgi:SAM-dependent methyltransferase